MRVYASEQEDNLYDKLQENRISATVSLVNPSDILSDAAKRMFDKKINQHISSAFASDNLDSFDLHRLYTILVTVGWNLNDDVFGVKEVWGARHSPEDKPFNLEHNPRHVIGHITGSVVVDDSYEVIPDDTSFDSLPSKFHILTSAVIYKHIKSRDEKLPDETKELLASIANGDWFVSMEALFSDFDYALTKAGQQQVLARNEETAFLTKHLRIHGGMGEYQGYKLGRHLKDITFSGKGLVKKPGNPESYVFNDVTMFKGAFASANPFKTEPTYVYNKFVTEYSFN